MPQGIQEKLPKEREYLVVDNLNLIHYCLKKTFHMSPYYPEYEDCFQEGAIGLILAAMRFDESRGFKFATYAYKMICGSIQRYKRDKGNAIRIPRDKYNLIIQVVRLTTEGYSFTEIEELTGYSSQDIHSAISMSCLDSLDRTIIDDSNQDVSLQSVIGNGTNDYEEMLSEEHVYECIPMITDSLKNKLHKDIWEEWIYSMLYGEKLTQQYFATKYTCSQAQVSRILNNCKKAFVKVLTK